MPLAFEDHCALLYHHLKGLGFENRVPFDGSTGDGVFWNIFKSVTQAVVANDSRRFSCRKGRRTND